MPINTLTDAKCKAAKPKEKAYKMFDGQGMFLWVSPKGAKVWRMAYRIDGKQQQISFGEYPAVSLAAARAKRDEHRTMLASGSDPMEQRRMIRTGKTMEQANNEYWALRSDLSPSYLEKSKRAIEMYLYPRLKDRNLATITRDDLLPILQGMDAAGKHVYVRKVRMWVGQIFDWAVENGHAEINPAALIDSRKAFGRAPVEHMAALRIHDVPDFMQRLKMEGQLQSVLGCKLLALTWTRTNELRGMKWDEIDGDLWRIPAERMKRRNDHIVPLSTQALEILDNLRMRSQGSDYVFPSDRRLDRPMSENAILYLIHRIGYKGKMTGHGWRAVASTWANENGHDKDAIEKQLAHTPDNKVRAVYNRAEYLPQRRKMLQEWADWLTLCEVNPSSAKRRELPSCSSTGNLNVGFR